ncbi:MAG TPA: DUF4166 domain-containing protein [Thermomonas sp.]
MDRALSFAPQATLFQQALGAAFFNLPEAVRRLHAVRGTVRYAGMATVERGGNPLARLGARITGLPKPGRDVPITVEFVADAKRETWRRAFGGMRMQTRLAFKAGQLRERLGPLHFRYRLHPGSEALWWQVAGVRVFGLVPLPAGWFEGVRCREREHDGRYEFLVEARLPLVGLVIRYEGWLLPVHDAGA